MGRRRNRRHNGGRNRRSRESKTKRDYISELPEPIIHKILSLLPTPDVTRSNILSKEWNRLWNSFPILDFDEYEIIKCYNNQFPKFTSYENFFVDANNSLKQNAAANNSIQKLRLFFMDKSWCSHIKYWVNFAIKRNLNELDIHIPCSKYLLPQKLFLANSITILKLTGMKLDPLNSINLSSLKKMTISQVEVHADTLYSIVINCRCIEELCVSMCDTLRYLWLSSLTLKSLKVKYCCGLRRIEIRHYYREESITNKISNLPALESLMVLDDNDRLECIKVVSPQLKILILVMERSTSFCASEVEIDTPNLLSFTYEGLPIYDFSITKSAILKATINLKCPFNTNWYPFYGGDWYCCLGIFLRNFDNSETSLFCPLYKDLTTDSKLFRDCALDPIHNIKHLKLREISMPPSGYELPHYLEFVDGFCWIFPHLETVFIEYGYRYKKCLKFQFEEDDSCIYRIAQVAPLHC